MSRSTTNLALCALAGLTLAGCGRSGGPTTAVTGTVTYRERIALPPDAVLEVTIDDVSRADAPAGTLAEARIDSPGNPPIAFSVPYDPRRIDARNRYAVRARIVVGGELWFTSDTAYPVLTQGNGNRAEIVVRSARGDAAHGVPDAGAPLAFGELPASFTGDLPCADCSGIRYDLVLHPDRTFFLRMTSLGRTPDAVLDDIGAFTVGGDGGTLVLHGTRGTPMPFAIVDARTLRKLDLEGRPIESKFPHEVVRTPSFAPFEPKLPLRGMYTYMADAGLFRECATGWRLPVAQEAENAALERGYAEARNEPGQEVLATVEGRIAERPKMEGEGTQRVLVVERVIGLAPGQSCPPVAAGGAGTGAGAGGGTGGAASAAAPALEGTEWVLTHLGRDPVTPPERGHRPFLLLQADAGRVVGSGGCNRLFGQYALTGNGLRFSGIGGTMMACPDMTLEQAFNSAIARVVTWRIDDRALELADEAGEPLLRFEPRPAP